MDMRSFLRCVVSYSEVDQPDGVCNPRVAIRAYSCIYFRDELLGILGTELTLGIEYIAFAVGYHVVSVIQKGSDKNRYVVFSFRL